MKKSISKGHEVLSLKNESIPLLKNRFLDKLTRVRWYIPLIIYIPIILYFVYQSFIQLTIPSIVLSLLCGILLWSITEYLFHRFIFHTVPKGEAGRKFHFIMHGIHHAYPNDSLRLVMPPTISLPISGLFCLIFYYLFGIYYTAIYSGFMAAYLVYDMLHYAIHHVDSPKQKWLISKKLRHMKHHYFHSESEFAVTSPYWDRIFNTFCPDETKN